jgi:hypothetical protein
MVAIYNDTIGNIHKHIASTHPSLHLARKCQSFEPKQLILISPFAFTNANNIIIKCSQLLEALKCESKLKTTEE